MKKYSSWILLSILVGVLSGLAATLFLVLLNIVTQLREQNFWIIWLLPLAGLMVGLAYHLMGKDVQSGNNLIFEEIHNPKKVLPLKMAPLILLGTIVTHLFGGSAGREGTAVQMGASLADQLSRFFKISASERKILLVAGTGAGFGAAVGAPWAGFIFGMEVIRIGHLKIFAWMECLIASFVGYYVCVLLQAPHSAYPSVMIPEWSFQTFLFIALAGILLGLVTRIFVYLVHAVEKLQQKLFKYPPLRPAAGGLLIAALFWLEGSHRYPGLGIPYIQEALQIPVSFLEPTLKTIFTALTIGSGFKGGEFIPLVFVGTTLGSALSTLIPVSLGLLAAVGFAALFAGASNTPIACSLLAMEIFGYQIAPYALLGCFMSYYFSGHKSIYKGQRLETTKYQQIQNLPRRLRSILR